MYNTFYVITVLITVITIRPVICHGCTYIISVKFHFIGLKFCSEYTLFVVNSFLIEFFFFFFASNRGKLGEYWCKVMIEVNLGNMGVKSLVPSVYIVV